MITNYVEACAVLAHVTFRNPPFPIWLNMRQRHETVHLEIAMLVRDREHGGPITARIAEPIMLPMRRDAFFAYVAAAVRGAFIHEFSETFHVNGVRVYDPHDGRTAEHSRPTVAVVVP